MGVKELFLGVDLPADVKMLYHGLMKKKIDLQNGWLAIVLKNNLAIFFKNGMQMMSFGAVRNIVRNPDGKFMVVRENGDKAIWNAKGYCLAAFSKDTELFDNGWYRKKLNDGLALFDNNGECIGHNLRNTEVFSNGFYFMSVFDSADGAFAGVYNNKKEKILFTNSSHVCMLRNGWFIVDGVLHDNFGEEYLSQPTSSKLSFLLLKAIGLLMPLRKS